MSSITIDFTDEQITSNGGAISLAQMAARLGLPALLDAAERLKQRASGASDRETLLALIFSLAQGDGALCEVDRLAADNVRARLLNLSRAPTACTPLSAICCARRPGWCATVGGGSSSLPKPLSAWPGSTTPPTNSTAGRAPRRNRRFVLGLLRCDGSPSSRGLSKRQKTTASNASPAAQSPDLFSKQ